MIHVVAIVTAHAGQRAAVLEAFAANAKLVREEAGCVSYEPVVDAEGFGAFQAPIGEDAFMVIEGWESADALRAHAVAPHMAEYGRRTKGMIASRVIHVLSPV